MKPDAKPMVRGTWGRRQGGQSSHCADWNGGQRALPFSSLPPRSQGSRAPRPDNDPTSLPRLPLPAGLLIHRAPARPRDSGAPAWRAFSPRTPPQPGLPFLVSLFPTRLQSLGRLFRSGVSAVPSASAATPFEAAISGSTARFPRLEAPIPSFLARVAESPSRNAFGTLCTAGAARGRAGRRRTALPRGRAGPGPRASLRAPPRTRDPRVLGNKVEPPGSSGREDSAKARLCYGRHPDLPLPDF
nr:uncharacterized protein LOC118968113 [Manis javanica]